MEAEPEFRQRVVDKVPLGRIADPEEVVGSVLFLRRTQRRWSRDPCCPSTGGTRRSSIDRCINYRTESGINRKGYLACEHSFWLCRYS